MEKFEKTDYTIRSSGKNLCGAVSQGAMLNCRYYAAGITGSTAVSVAPCYYLDGAYCERRGV